MNAFIKTTTSGQKIGKLRGVTFSHEAAVVYNQMSLKEQDDWVEKNYIHKDVVDQVVLWGNDLVPKYKYDN